MSVKRYLGSYRLTSPMQEVLEGCRGRLRLRAPTLAVPSNHNPTVPPIRVPPAGVGLVKHGYGYGGFMLHKGLQLIAAESQSCHKADPLRSKEDLRAKGNLGSSQPGLPPPPPKSSFSLWVRRILGTVLSLLLPFWMPKWKKLYQLEGEVEVVVEEVENIAEMVEKVATMAEKVSAEVADALPSTDEHGGSGTAKLRDAALFVERVSKETAKDAQVTQDFVHKVEELKKDLEEVGTMVEPLIHKIADK